MKERYKLLVLVILIFLSVALLLVALDNLIFMSPYVIVEGVVLDDKGYPVAGVEVSVGNCTALTDASGNYKLRVPRDLALTLGNVTARAPGFCEGRASITFSGWRGKCNVRLNATAETISNWNSRRICIEGGSSSKSPIFSIRGRTYTHYVRTMIGEVYDNGSWLLPEDAPHITYAEEHLRQDIVNFAKSFTVSVEIQPLMNLSGFIPAMKNPNKVSTVFPLQYFPQQQIFFSNFSFTQPYNITYTIYDFDIKTLKAARVSESEKYTSVPRDLLEKLRPLALDITEGLSSPFEKLVAIEEFLRRNYSYKPPENCTPAPAGVDPVEWFLFHARCGYCAHFNSAFVLLARSIGIPARLCAGYLVNPSAEFQVVKGKQRHAYAEALFEGLGWITFDATAPCNLCVGGSEPSLRVILPKNGTFVSGSRITIVGEVSGFYKDACLSVNNTSFSLSYWNSEGQFSFDNCTCIADGKLTVKIGIWDASGSNLSGTVSFVVDNMPPSVEIVYPQDGMRVFKNTIYINGTVRELNKGDLKPYINDTRFTLVEWDQSSGFFSFMNKTQISGRVSVEVSFRDLAGNVGSDIVSFNAEAKGLKRISTRTVVTRVSPIVLKGSWFSVEGSVSDVKGSAVSGLQVIIYIYSEDKSQLISECGRGLVVDGFFNITCYVGKEVKVGKYQVVAYTCGNDAYDSSWSDPPITVAAETCMEVKAPGEVIMGRPFSVEGALKEKFSGDAVVNQTVVLKVDGRSYTLQTDGKGMFTWNCTLWNPGNYTLNAIFEETETYLNTAKMLTIRVLNITIEFITNSSLIRSEVAQFTGRVHAENLPLDFEDLAIKLDGAVIAEVKTDSQGFFGATVPIPSSQSLGSAVLSCSLKHYPISITQNVNILARTRLACHAADKLHSNERFNATVRLTDDHGQPVANAAVKLKCLFNGKEVEAANVTDSQGIAEFRGVKLKEGFRGNFTYTVSFEGNGFYLPCAWAGTAYAEAEPPNSMLLIISTILLALVCAVSALVWIRWRRNPPSKVDMEEAKAQASAVQPAPTNKIALEFPQIRGPFPNIWSLGEPLLIRVRLADSEGKPIPRATVKVVFNGEASDVTTSEDGCADVEKVFESKGVKKVRAQFIDKNSGEVVCEATVKVVDYREEVVELFNSFIEKLKAQNQDLRNNMTPRELQAAIACQSTPEKRNSLEMIVSVFEVANYSLHQVTRKEYEKMFLSIREFEGLKIE